MKKRIRLLVFTLFISIASLAQQGNLRAYFSYATFYIPGQGSFVETYLAVEGSSVVYKMSQDGSFRSTIEITMLFRQHDTIRDYAKYELKSPAVQDTSSVNFGFIDQQRFLLHDGEYELEILIADLNSKQPGFRSFERIELFYPQNKINLSGIQLLEKFEKSTNVTALTKSGYDLIPMVYAYYPESMNTLNFYGEIYNTDKLLGKDEPFMVNYFIESYENNKRMLEFFSRRKMTASAVGILLQKLDISRLPSGNYQLVVEVRNKKNELFAISKSFFQRSNPSMQFNLGDIASININNTFASRITNADTLKDHLMSLAPISTQAERSFAQSLVITGDAGNMQKYLYNFWSGRAQENPSKAWDEYYLEVRKVQAAYKTKTKRGYQTDRGRVYLKYGPPNQITESYSEPGAYPYEIWHYYTLNDQRNKKFVFYSKDMVTNDFVLIHSDAIGELANYRWQLDIYKRVWDPNNIDQTSPEDTWGNRASDYFNQPGK
jgi:GWxTD domain-containing protein